MASPPATGAGSSQSAEPSSLSAAPSPLESSPSPSESKPSPSESAPLPLESQDPRIRRTRQLLQQSLACLLTTREFERLSVQEITAAAGLNRATFYAHYPDKFALLECMVAARFHALLDERGIVFDGTCTNALQGIVLGVCDFLAQTLAAPSEAPTKLSSRPDPSKNLSSRPEAGSPASVLGSMGCAAAHFAAAAERPAVATATNTIPNHLPPHMESAIVAVVRAMLLDGIRQHPPASGDTPELLAATISWAIYGAAKEWVQTPNHSPSEQIAATVQRLVAPLLNPESA